MSYSSFLVWYCFLIIFGPIVNNLKRKGSVSEWLRSEIANLMLSECVSSNLTAVESNFFDCREDTYLFSFSQQIYESKAVMLMFSIVQIKRGLNFVWNLMINELAITWWQFFKRH